MRRILLLFSGLISILGAIAQTEFPPAYIIVADTLDVYLPEPYWQIMADSSEKMALPDVIRSGHFQHADRKIDYQFNTYWIRYRIVNRMDREVDIYPSFHQEAEYVNLYMKIDSGSWQQYKSGTLVPWSKRDGLKSLIAIHLTIPVGKTVTIYEKRIFDHRISAPGKTFVYFCFAPGISIREQSHYVQSLWSVFLLGIILLAVIINVYFYLIVREKEFLFFSLLVFFIGLKLIAGVSLETGYLGDVFFKNYPLLQYYLADFQWIFYWFFFIYFIRHVLKTFRDFPRWDKYLVGLSLATIIISIFLVFRIAILGQNLAALAFFTYMGLFLVIGISFLVTLLFYVWNKDKIRKIMVFALAPAAILLTLEAILSFPANINYLYAPSSETPSGFMETVWALLGIVRTLENIGLVWMAALFASVLFMRFSMLRRKYAEEKLEREQERSVLMAQQKTELEKQVIERTAELRKSLEDLKFTQRQLIQSEKMASLGELTAGIAHEIQNPLNFMNNFSEVNKELLEEMKDELDKGNTQEAKIIADNVINNEEKINHHGKRADSIVKGMLQHSRSSNAIKEQTDINALAEEYLRLSYHGLRAKDKEFNTEIKTEFDEAIGKINIIPQDIGRVLLNLYNNAFYAANEKKKQSVTGFEPTVTVSTKKNASDIEIKVSDNGSGISQKVVDKIFQPFFTTKPTGQGTGLGLSLSYDIVKAHGGELKVETKEGEGSEFIVQLPVV